MSKSTNLLATINSANFVEVMSTAVNTIADNLGYKPNVLEIDEDGKALVPIYDTDNKCVIESLEKLPDNVVTAVNQINALKSLDDISGVYLASAVYELANFAENNGFTSVGKFVSEMIPRIKGNYANQLYNVAKTFLKYDENNAPAWKYDFCKGCSISNLALLMPLVNKSGSVEDFIKDYIDTDKVHPRKVQSKLKEELSAFSENKGKGKSKSKDKSSEKSEEKSNVMPLETAWAMVRERVLGFSFAGVEDNEALVNNRDNAVKAIDIILEMITDTLSSVE